MTMSLSQSSVSNLDQLELFLITCLLLGHMCSWSKALKHGDLHGTQLALMSLQPIQLRGKAFLLSYCGNEVMPASGRGRRQMRGCLQAW